MTVKEANVSRQECMQVVGDAGHRARHLPGRARVHEGGVEKDEMK